MSRSVLVTMAISFATTALVSVGGIAAMVPEIHRQAVDVYGWMDDAQFASAFAISQIAPGPNILLMSLVGWRVAGLGGLIVATLATMVPTCLIALAAHRAEARLLHARWYAIMRRSLPPIVVGLIIASAAVIAKAAITAPAGVLIAAGVALHVTLTRTNPLVPLSAAILCGIVAGRLGYL
jgi:chromate transporter